MKNPRFDYEEPVLFLVEKKEDKKRFLRNLFVDTYEKDPRANIGFPGKYQKSFLFEETKRKTCY